jgi:parallel beta-helix repeat protein
VTVRNNDFQHIWGAAIELAQGTADNRVIGNAIRWVGEVYVAESAIQLNESAGNLIRGNLIRDVPRMGIGELHYDPAITSGGNIIELNTIIHAMQQTSDGGAIYIYSSSDDATLGDTIRFNRIIDAGGLETEPGGFRHGREYSNGIYLDDFTSGVTVTGNFVQGAVRGGIYLHGGSDNTVWNNITLDNEDIGIQLFAIGGRPMLGNDLYNNIVGMTGPGGQTVELESAYVAPGTMHDNWFLRPATQFSYQTFAQWQAMGFEAGSEVIASGIFRDPQTGDFRLLAGSLPLAQGFVDLPWAQMQAFRGGVIRAGTESADHLYGAKGGDLLIGLGGRDWFQGGRGADEFEGGLGSDILSYQGFGAGVRARLSGVGWQGDRAEGVENLFGSAFGDVLTGDTGANRLAGWRGNDLLVGGAGPDRMIGGAGADRLVGGTGADVFVFGAFAGIDRVVDFQHGTDKVDLRDLGNLTWRGTAAFTGNAREVRLATRDDGQHLLIDIDRDGRTDVHILLQGTGVFTAGDLLL